MSSVFRVARVCVRGRWPKRPSAVAGGPYDAALTSVRVSGQDERRVGVVEEVVPDVAEPVADGLVQRWARALRQKRSKPRREETERAPMMSRARAVDSCAALEAAASATATRTETSAYSS